MCGIVGYVGTRQAQDLILDGLASLEYRGYDSSGLSVLSNGKIKTQKTTGRVEALREKLKNKTLAGTIGIGHTRWATHGGVTKSNAHPHLDQTGAFSVIHNGIIENHEELRSFLLAQGYVFASETDTEIIPNLISYHFKETKDVQKAFVRAISELTGAYGIAMISSRKPDTIYCTKLSSPLAIGKGEQEVFIASDAVPMASYTSEVVYLEDGDIAIVRRDGFHIIDSATELALQRKKHTIITDSSPSGLGSFSDFMSKEIHETPQTVRAVLSGRLNNNTRNVKLGGFEAVAGQLDHIERIIILGCGTSLYAGMVGEYLLEEIAGIPVEVQQASEFRYRNEPLSRSTAVLVVSQSGETADTIACLKKLEGTGILTLGVVNAPGSTLARMTDAGVYCHAGPEKAVASTKAFVAQTTVLALMALYLSTNSPHYTDLMNGLHDLPNQLEKVIDSEKQIQKMAKKYAASKNFLYIGRRYAYPAALEGALKLKEISYIHAEGFAGGEMKHGPLALVEPGTPTLAIALSNTVSDKTVSNIQEIKARGGPIISLVDSKHSQIIPLADDYLLLPRVIEQLQPIVAATAMHLFAYHVASELGRDIDKPRNLAKSVTVE